MQHKNSSEVDVADDPTSHRRILTKILENLDEWNLRIATVDIKLMYNQLAFTSTGESGAWLDAAAGAIVDIFRLVESDDQGSSGTTMDIDEPEDKNSNANRRKKFNSVWIIPYLVRNLKFLQSRVLKVSCQILECGNMFKSAVKPQARGGAGNRKDTTSAKEQSKGSAGHQPFLQLVLTCLRELDNTGADSKKQDRDEQKENLLQSLHSQLSTYLFFTKDNDTNHEDAYARKSMQDALQLRLSLVGGVFDTICRNTTSVTEWSTLLVQLVVRGVVDLTNNSDLFTTVLDMINIMIHSTLINDREAGNSERSEENRKHYNYHALVKKLKKEMGEKASPSLKYLRQLLPLPKMMTEVIVTEPFGLVNEKVNKGFNKVKGLNCDKKPGLQVSEKQKISPWDILEGHKTPAPLSWAWFGAVKHERKPMRYEEGFQELKYASLGLEKSEAYYLDPPPLPPEDLEPASTSQNMNMNKMGQDQMNQMMMSRSGTQQGMMMPGGQGMMQTGQTYPGGPAGNNMGGGHQMMQQQPMINTGAAGPAPGAQNMNMGYPGGGYGQRMPYMQQQQMAQGGMMQQPMRGAMVPGGPRGAMMGGISPGMSSPGMGNMNMPPQHPHQMMARGGRPMMPANQGNLPAGARPSMISPHGMYQQGGAPNQPGMMGGPGGPGGQQWGNSGAGAGYNSPQQYAAQPPYHSPQMQGGGQMGQRFPGPQGGPPQGSGVPQGRPIGNPKQALQDMIRARNTDPQFSTAPGSNFMPPAGRTSFPMRPSMARMPQTTMYGSSASNQPQYMNTGNTPVGPGSGPGGGYAGNPSQYGNFQGQGNQYPSMMQNQQGQQRPGNYVGNQMAMRAQGQPQGGYPMGGQRGPNPGQPGGFMGGQQGYRQQMGGMNQQQQQQQNMMRMQNPQLMAQLQRGPGNMNPQQQQQMGGYGGPPQQQNRY